MDDAIWYRLQQVEWSIPGPFKFMIIAEAVLTCQGRCSLKLFVKVHVTYSRTIKIYDYSRDGAWIVIGDAIWNRLQKYAWPTPGPSTYMNIAETVLTLSWTMLFEIVCKIRMDHCRTNQTYDYSWDGAYIVLGDAIWNRTRTHVSTTPGPSKSGITAEAVLTLSWMMLFEIVCKRSHDPLHDQQKLWL